MTKAYIKLNNNEAFRHYALLFLIFLLILNGIFYLFFINFGVSEIFLKKNILNEIKAKKEENQMLEGKYLAIFKNIGLEQAYNVGFIEDKNPSYASRTALVAAAASETKNR